MTNITICGSIAFFTQMQKIKQQLEDMGHSVKIPPTKVKDQNGNFIPVEEYYKIRKQAEANNEDTVWIWQRKTQAMKAHFDKIVWADSILVLNYEKNGVAGYIGANTFLEMGVALHLNKPIYLLNPIPEQASKEEILGMQPIIINSDLSKLN